MIETPKNLTRNILLGMFLGFVVGSLLYYVSFFSDSFLEFIKVYVFNLGSAIFIHLTKNFTPTLGCIALKKMDFLILIKLINKKTKIKIL